MFDIKMLLTINVIYRNITEKANRAYCNASMIVASPVQQLLFFERMHVLDCTFFFLQAHCLLRNHFVPQLCTV